MNELLRLIATAWATKNSESTVFRAPVVLIDGRSGSGKTDLTTELASAWNTQLTIVHLDDIYPGWNGLCEASEHVHDYLLSAREPRWQRYDWISGSRSEWVFVDPSLPLIIEGAGCLSRQNSLLATFSIWLELDDAARHERARARDGDNYAPQWENWAAQETAFIRQENPMGLADIVLNRG